MKYEYYGPDSVVLTIPHNEQSYSPVQSAVWLKLLSASEQLYTLEIVFWCAEYMPKYIADFLEFSWSE